jgi:hypothetical protein
VARETLDEESRAYSQFEYQNEQWLNTHHIETATPR